MSYNRIALITGGNRGLGLEAVRQLSEQEPQTLVLMGSRNVEAGEKAIRQLRDQHKHPYKNIQVIPIDVTSQSSVDESKQIIKDKYKGLDVLVNNAGVVDAESPRRTLEVNYYGVKRVYHAFAPLLNTNARVVYVGSGLGLFHLYDLPESLKNKFESETLTEAQLDEECEAYIAAAKKGTDEVKKRYGGDNTAFAYTFSKVLVHTLLRVHSRLNHVKGCTYVAVDPGYCATDLNQHSGFLPASEGGSRILKAIQLPQDEKLNGTMWSESKQSPFAVEWQEEYAAFKPQ